MSNFTVKVIGLEKLAKKLDNVPDGWKIMLEDAAKFAQSRAKEYAKPHPADKGTLALGVKFELAPGPHPLHARVYPAAPIAGIAFTVEEGRAPGKQPPLQAIARWVTSHGIGVKAWHIAQDIKAKGTKGVHMFQRAAKETEGKLPQFIAHASGKIKKDWDS